MKWRRVESKLYRQINERFPLQVAHGGMGGARTGKYNDRTPVIGSAGNFGFSIPIDLVSLHVLSWGNILHVYKRMIVTKNHNTQE